MSLTREEGLQLIAHLWVNEFPLTRQYFGKYLSQLLTAMLGQPFDGRFVNAALFPGNLEKMLVYIEQAGQTAKIIAEVGSIQDAAKLDARLLDAWAELRTIFQLLREGFSNVCKVSETADLTASRADALYAFQVKRINNLLWTQVVRRNEPDKRDDSPEGELSDIQVRLNKPASWLFWDTTVASRYE